MRYGWFAKALTMVSASMLVACSGGHTSGGDSDYEEETFSGDSIGRIEVKLSSDEIPVGVTTEFQATVYDSLGQPVPNIRIACDSEEGVAIIEPTTGSSLAGQRGAISGLIGCERPGSFQFGCRLPVGGDKRQFVGVRCTGDVPQGFEGFDGAAGGGLGGGVVGPDAGGPGADDNLQVRILSLTLDTNDDSAAEGDTVFQIDTANSLICGEGSNLDFENFGDDYMVFKVINDSPLPVRFSGYSYQVEDGLGGGIDAQSPIIRVGTNNEVKPGQEVEFSALFANAIGGRKYFVSDTLPAANGFKNVLVTLKGTASDGAEITASAYLNISFDNFKVCDG